MKQIIITVLVVAGIIGLAVAVSGDDPVAGEESNNFYGLEEGVITVTEYGDFECPACAGFFPIVTQVKEQFIDQIRFEFKHFPLVQIHPHATAAHRAAQAAANQGKFWEMHDLLYQRQAEWRASGQVGANGVPIASGNISATLEGYALEIGLDVDQYLADVRDSASLGVVNADIDKGKSLGANSTPTFFIDGVLVEDLTTISTVEGFSQAIQEAIDAKNGASSGSETESTETIEETAKPEDN